MYPAAEHTVCRPFSPGGVVAVGWYDGVHRGHRQALSLLRRTADEHRTTTGVVLLDDDRGERRLTSIEQRVELLSATGMVDTIWVVRAPASAWCGHAPEFIRDVLLRLTRAGMVLTTTGPSQGPLVQAFGQQLVAMASDSDLRVLSLDEAQAEWDELSSSCSTGHVAALLDQGDVAAAAVLLGRHHEMKGVVERGDQRGRTLGFPTANVGLPVSYVIPGEGVYAGWLTDDDGTVRPAAISLGRRPTFYPDGLALLETHVLDFTGDLYGHRVSVAFAARVRDQRRFTGPDELVAQLQDDIARTRSMLQEAPPT